MAGGHKNSLSEPGGIAPSGRSSRSPFGIASNRQPGREVFLSRIWVTALARTGPTRGRFENRDLEVC
jgi:hypothetical protein